MNFKRKKLISILILVLSFVLLLQGCMPYLPELSPPVIQLPEVDPVPVPNGDGNDNDNGLEYEDFEPPIPGTLMLRYDSERVLNPITALNRDNINLTALMYESLFVLNDVLLAEPLLVSSWSTEDYITFTFEILPNIAMHDGSTLTANDVAYSLNEARRGGRHSEKLTAISNITTYEELTVIITLSAPNARFTRLLDVPIIKEGTIQARVPPGTGPFIFPYPDAFVMTPFRQHRHYNDLPLDTIFLKETTDGELSGLFDAGLLGLIWDDPTGAYDLRPNSPHEPRFYNTTALHFIGFNSTRQVLQNQDVRRAIGNAIDRHRIVDEIMSTPRPGQAIAAPVAISPTFDMYDREWEVVGQDPLVEMAFLLERAGLQDFDHDGFLEMSDGFGFGRAFTLDFIVNIENAHKVAAAHAIADTLIRNGINTNVRELPWETFMTALSEGTFDMFYGETMLGADFDLSPLLLPGPLNFGRTASSHYERFIQDFLAASTQEQVSFYGQRLIDEIRATAPFVPILYKRHAIYTPVGFILRGASPSQSSIFRNLHEWEIDLYELNEPPPPPPSEEDELYPPYGYDDDYEDEGDDEEDEDERDVDVDVDDD